MWACKGFRNVPSCQLSGVFYSSIHTTCSFSMGLKSITVRKSFFRSSGIDDLMQQGWLCMAGYASGRHWCSPSGIRRHGGCVMKQLQYSSLILMNSLMAICYYVKWSFSLIAVQYNMSWYLICEDIFVIYGSFVSVILRQWNHCFANILVLQ